MPRAQDAAIKRLAPAVDRSRAEWRLLRARLSTITPQALGRGVLSTVVVVVAAVLARETWPALLPFAIGGLLAYTIYPIVDRLDRVMPRVLAAALALAGGLAVLVLVVAVVLPPLVAVTIQFFRDMPDSAQLADLRAQLDAYLATLPEGARALVVGILERVGAIARDGSRHSSTRSPRWSSPASWASSIRSASSSASSCCRSGPSRSCATGVRCAPGWPPSSRRRCAAT